MGLVLVSGCAAPTAEDGGPVFYPPLPQQPRIQFLTTINSEADIGGGSGAFKEFLTGRKEATRALHRPFDVAHGNKKIYVVDTRLNAVVVIDLAKGSFDRITDTRGGPLKQPMSVSVDDDGFIYIADKGRGQVVVFNPQNKYHFAYGSKEQFEPLDAVVHGDRVYVADVRDSEIEVLDKKTGNLITKLGEKGKEHGRFHWPTHLAVDGKGHLFVTDFLNFRVQQFDSEGKFVIAAGGLGTWPGAMPRPKGVAVDNEGYLYEVDAAFELVQVYNADTGEPLLAFGKFQTGPGSTWLPAGIDVDYDNVGLFSKYAHPDFRPKYLIYVVNQAGFNRLNVYAFGDWQGALPQTPPPATPDKKAEPGES